MNINLEEWIAISQEIEERHALFYQFWRMGRPRFDSKIDTAAISFNKDGGYLEFIFSPDFWSRLTQYERAFVICHESLHVLFNHGYRMKDTDNIDLSNTAMDIVVNHYLVNNFGFIRSRLSMEKTMCWTDTVFTDKLVPDNQSYEYYFNLLKTADKGSGATSIDNHEMLNMPTGGGQGQAIRTGSPIDSHDMLEGISTDSVIQSLAESLTEEEAKEIKKVVDNDKNRGTGALGILAKIVIPKVAKKKKWETVIKKWSRKFLDEDAECEQWVKVNRRFIGLPRDFILPTVSEIDWTKEHKINVWFFQDCSGSCWGLKDRFFKAAKSLDPDRFNIRMHSFDDRIYQVKLTDNSIRGGGGTSFSIIEDYIQKEIKQTGSKYPEAVFVITDGYGNMVSPEYPKKWHWFLSTSYKNCIPDECNIHSLANFE